MAKKSKPKTNVDNILITDSGDSIKILPISMYEMELAEQGTEKAFRDRGEQLDIPTYTVQMVGGGEQLYEHDAESLVVQDDEEKTKENQKIWADYEDANNRLSNELGALREEMIFVDGIDADPDTDEMWIATCKRRHIEIPKDPIDKKMLYIRTKVLKTPLDIVNAIQTVMTVSMGSIVPEEVKAAVAATFQSAIQDAAEELEQSMDSTEGTGTGAGKLESHVSDE